MKTFRYAAILIALTLSLVAPSLWRAATLNPAAASASISTWQQGQRLTVQFRGSGYSTTIQGNSIFGDGGCPNGGSSLDPNTARLTAPYAYECKEEKLAGQAVVNFPAGSLTGTVDANGDLVLDTPVVVTGQVTITGEISRNIGDNRRFLEVSGDCGVLVTDTKQISLSPEQWSVSFNNCNLTKLSRATQAGSYNTPAVRVRYFGGRLVLNSGLSAQYASGASATISPPACKPDLPQPGNLPPASSAGTSKTDQARLNKHYSQLPLSFEANQGQTDAPVKFLSHGAGYGLFLTPTEAVLALRKPQAQATPSGSGPQPEERAATLRMKFRAANPNPQVTGLAKLPGQSNYFMGNDPQQWHTEITNYAKVEYQDLYPGVNLVYYGKQRQLEYDLIVAPGVNPKSIQLAFEGADKIEIDAQGDLVLHTSGGALRQHKPVTYQEVDGVRKPISSRYVRRGKYEVGFQVGRYNRRQPLIIDPALSYSTFLGGGDSDEGFDIAVDSAGNTYVTGRTFSARSFPVKNAFQSAGQGSFDAFVTKLDPSKSGADSLIYSTFLGSGDADEGFGIAVDGAGNAYVTGRTLSAQGFPVRNAIQSAGQGSFDAFVTKLNAAGNGLLYSTFLGGGDRDEGFGIAVDGAGNAYVTGRTFSARGFPVLNAIQSEGQGSFDAFVTKLNTNPAKCTPMMIGRVRIECQESFHYSTFLGGGDDDLGADIAVDAAGNAYITGRTFSAQGFPVLKAIQSAGQGSFDAFVTKLNTSPAKCTPLMIGRVHIECQESFLYSTFLGGGDSDEGCSIAVDGAGIAYVTGRTFSAQGFPVRNAIQSAGQGSFDAFVTKLNTSPAMCTPMTFGRVRIECQESFLYSTFLGGGDDDEACGIAVDTLGNAYVSGFTLSARGFPALYGVQSEGQGSFDAFVTKLKTTHTTCTPGSLERINIECKESLLYSTFLGGGDSDQSFGIAVDADDHAYITGRTFSARGFPTKNAFQAQGQGSFDAFVAKLTTNVQVQKSLNFGGVGLGDMKDLPLVLRNIDNRRIKVESLTSSAPREFSVVSRGAPFVIEPETEQVVMVRFTPLAEGARNATLSIVSDDPGRPQFAVTFTGNGLNPNATAAIDTSPLSLDFSGVATGQSKDLTLTVRSTGQASLTLNPSGSNNARFTVIAPALPVTIVAGAQQTLTVRFAPTATGAQAGTLTLNSNATNRPALAIALSGTGVGTLDIAISPASLDFGSIVLGQTSGKTLTVSNPGSASLSIYAVRSSNPSFLATLPTAILPLSVPPSGAITFPVFFKPTSVGAQTGTLLVASNATDKNTLAVQVRGETPGEILATDDGTVETGALQDGLLIVNRLTPSRYPGTLRGLRIFFAQFQGVPSPAGEQIRLVAFADPAGTGQPPANPTLLVNQMVTIPSIPANGGFVDFPVSVVTAAAAEMAAAPGSLTPESLTIERGDIYVGFQSPRPARGVVFAADSNGPQQQRAFFSTNDGSSYTKLTGLQVQGSLTPVNIMTQAAVGGIGVCTYVISPDGQVFGSGGGGGTVTVTTQSGCGWSANSTSEWITFPPNSGSTDSGMVNFTVAAGSVPRQAVVTIAGQNFIVAQAEQVASVSSASYQRLGLAGEAIAAAFGTTLATALQSATSVPLPTSLAGTTVKVRDAIGVELFAPLFFVSPGQINFLMPPGLAPGIATVTVTNSNGASAVAAVLNDVIAPGLFTANANGQGVAAAVALRIKANGAQSFETIARFDTATQRFVSTPLDLGPAGEQVFLLLFGTGLRGRSSLTATTLLIGGMDAQVLYVGAQGDLVGLDQINVAVPRTLAGRGNVDVVVRVDGKTANAVTVQFK